MRKWTSSTHAYLVQQVALRNDLDMKSEEMRVDTAFMVPGASC
jgi:hypothetical protein